MTVYRSVGIDPGVAGAIAVLHAGELDHVFDMPVIEVRGKKRIDSGRLTALLISFGPVSMVTVEDVQGVQGSGATSAFNFGRGVGIIEGICVALDRPLNYVRPQVWTKALNVGADKGAHRQAAIRRWPEHAEAFARVKDDGRADAALIAWWNWRHG